MIAHAEFMPQTLTEREQQVLDYVVEYLQRNSFQPSIREIGKALGIRSTRSVSHLLHILSDKGWIARDKPRSRGIRLLPVALGETEPGSAVGPGPDFEEQEPDDAMWMQRALEQARAAVFVDEVPVGAVLVHSGRIVSEAYNLTRTVADPTAHAEMVALRTAAERMGVSRLLDTTLYVTLEPCAMCAGSLVLAKVARLVYGASDPKTGMCGSLGCIAQDRRLNHRARITRGVLASQAGDLLRDFFTARR
ncbi:MAG: tRNA adenosine(34) deaminase TadA [Longimicrobiales bacterium]